MENITANAHYNLKEVPQNLYVNGTITTYRPDDILLLEEATSQGINENILILELKIIEGTAPMKGQLKHFGCNIPKTSDKMYKQVTIEYGDKKTLTVDVEILG